MFFLDSRGASFETMLRNEYGSVPQVDLWFHGGAKLEDLAFNAKYYEKNNPHDVIFIVGGINDVTVKDRQTKRISFPGKDPVVLAKHLIDRMEEAETDFLKTAPATNIVFCNLTGADLTRALKREAEFDQQILNEAVYLYNEEIFQRNIMKNLFAPDMASPVHRQVNGKNMTFLSHLVDDGIHLGEELKKKWVKKIVKTIEKYRS